MTRNTVYLWVDLETTGLDTHTDMILEMGACLTGDDMMPFAMFTQLVWDGPDTDHAIETADPAVIEMHNKSGLFNDLFAPTSARVNEEEMWELFSTWLLMHIGTDDEVVICGSGIVHFDLPILNNRWLTAKPNDLAYWVIDVGVVRRALRLCGITYPVGGSEGALKKHRALDDALAHAQEFRAIRHALSPGTLLRGEA